MKKTLKTITVLIITLILAVSSLPMLFVSAEKYFDFNVTFPEEYNYKVFKSGDDLSELSKIVSKTEKELENYFNENDIKVFAIDEKQFSQVKISSYSDSFSKKVGEFSNYSKKELLELAESLFENAYIDNPEVTDVVKTKEGVFLKNFEMCNDNGGHYTFTQYVTVTDSKIYRFSVLAYIVLPQDLDEEIFETFYINKQREKAQKTDRIIIVAVILISLFVAIAVFLVIGIIKRLRKVQDEEITEQKPQEEQAKEEQIKENTEDNE